MSVLVISYSRDDQPQVRALVALLKAGLRDVEKAVFWDEEFEPGEPWFDQLKAHIDASPQLFVFWCHHSNASDQVRREFSYALARDKQVVPVLLDDTPLADELAPIHGIDLRGAIRHSGRPRTKAFSDAPRTPMRSGWKTRTVIGWAAAAVIIAIVGLATFTVRRPPMDAEPVPTPSVSSGGFGQPAGNPPPPPVAPVETIEPISVAFIVVLTLLTLGLSSVLFVSRFRTWRRRRLILREFARHLASSPNG